MKLVRSIAAFVVWHALRVAEPAFFRWSGVSPKAVLLLRESIESPCSPGSHLTSPLVLIRRPHRLFRRIGHGWARRLWGRICGLNRS